MVNYLQDSQKLIDENERKLYNKSDDNNSNSSDDISKYMKSENETKKYSESTTNAQHNNGNNNQSNSIFQKSVQAQSNYKFDGGEGKEDGGKKDIPDDYDNYNELSEEGKMLKRLDMLRKLGELAQYKVKLSQNYNMNSDYFTMKYEYQLHTNIRAKQNFVNWTSSLMLNCIYGVEILNDKYNPFELKLTGWSEQINADITNYYDVFGEIYEKYNKPGKSMSPELKLILMLGGSALKFHLNNVAMSGRLGLPNAQQMNRMGGFNGPGGPMGSQENVPGQDPKVIEQMRQQAMIDRIREETKKQAEALQKKSEEQHDAANKQMQDMLLLQQKQNEYAQQENLKRQKMEEFERVKAIMEQTQAQQPRPTALPNPFSSMNNMQQFNGPQVSAFTNQRREEIDRQLQDMKNNLNTLNQQGVRQTQAQDIRDLNAEKLYARNPTQKNSNIKSRNSGITVDTSSESSSKKSAESTSSSKASSKASSSSSSSSSESNAKSKSQNSSKKNFIDRSLSSRNNQSSMSKRKYKKQLTFDTS
jgi:hypothetical protein